MAKEVKTLGSNVGENFQKDKTPGSGTILVRKGSLDLICINKLNLIANINFSAEGDISINVFNGKKTKTAGTYYKSPKK